MIIDSQHVSLSSSLDRENDGSSSNGSVQGRGVWGWHELVWRLRLSYARLSLFERYVIFSTTALAVAFTAVGTYASDRIANEVLQSIAGPQALYISSYIEPFVQQLASPDAALNLDEIASLNKQKRELSPKGHLLSLKIWSLKSTLVYSTDPSLIGKRFTSSRLAEALKGNIVASRATLDEDDDKFEQSVGEPMYELFAPLYESKTGRMIAVGEYYQDARELVRRTNAATRLSWVLISTLGALLWLFLLILVRAGSTTIEKQKRLLKQQLREQSRLRLDNDVLAGQIQRAMHEVERIDTQVEREVALDLHDGAAQLLSFAILKVDLLEETLVEPARGEMAALRNVLNDALQDIRSIAGGLFLPQTDDADIVTVVRAVINSYTHLTGRRVKAALDPPLGPIDNLTIRCVARVVREALANGFKHAAGLGQEISLKFPADRLTLEISDEGPGLIAEPGTRLGLKGMVARVQALNGQLSIANRTTTGTILTVSIPVNNR